MDPHNPNFFTWLVIGLGVFTLCASLPLIYRLVPMNRAFGVRVREAFASDERWYDINAYAGRQMAGWSCVIIATGFVGFFVPLRFFVHYELATAAIIVICAFVPMVRTARWIRSTRQT